MKNGFNTTLATTILLLVVIFIFMAFKSTSTIPQEKTKGKANIEIPEDVSKIFDKSCFGCHNVESKSEDARDALMIDKLPNMKKHKIVAKLEGIAAVVKDGDMPPSKFLENYPESTLTDEEATRLVDWATSAAENLVK